MSNIFKAVFFDLDHTLWDFETNSEAAIRELLDEHPDVKGEIGDLSAFMNQYRLINKDLWDRYHINAITRDELRVWRFEHVFSAFKIYDKQLARHFSTRYLEICPVKTALFPGALEVLEQLRSTHSLYIITNGFREVQYKKLLHSGLIHYFDKVHISEEIGWKKPDSEIFIHAVREAGQPFDKCVMVGDNPETDISGALNVGIQPILFDPEGKKSGKHPVWNASSLDEVASLISGQT
ncbi:MAG TPA: YjjG family noncanonical pyrimidine nucleotidase [Bacteroidia bacterium]|nr:YjjG family noncanonical pyrimidine nucleotidase [Bacteroidia bacterium]